MMRVYRTTINTDANDKQNKYGLRFAFEVYEADGLFDYQLEQIMDDDTLWYEEDGFGSLADAIQSGFSLIGILHAKQAMQAQETESEGGDNG